MNISVVKVGIAGFQAWTLTKASGFVARQRPNSAGSFILMPRPTNLRSQKGGDFVALAAATSEAGAGLYALTSAGVVGYMQSTARDFEKLLDLKASCTQLLDLMMGSVNCCPYEKVSSLTNKSKIATKLYMLYPPFL